MVSEELKMTTREGERQVRVYYRFEEIDEAHPSTQVQVEVAPASPPLNILAPDEGKPGFWRRQFGEDITPGQRKFDWTFGFILPLICFYFDPVVFRSDRGFGAALLGNYQIAAYFTGFVTTMTLVAWLLWRDRFGSAASVVASVLSIASVVSLTIGIAIFPYSLLGMIVLIGFLGFTPLFTSFVYGRNAVRAFRAAGRS
jgi:hypothetical protein